MAEQVKAMRNDSTLHAVLRLSSTRTKCPSVTSSAFPTVRGRCRAVPTNRRPRRWEVPCDRLAHADFKTSALWVEFLASYNVCDSEGQTLEEEARACRVSGGPPLSFTALCGRGRVRQYLEAVMHASLPMVVAHDIDLGLDASTEEYQRLPRMRSRPFKGCSAFASSRRSARTLISSDRSGFEDRIMSTIQAILKKKARPPPSPSTIRMTKAACRG